MKKENLIFLCGSNINQCRGRILARVNELLRYNFKIQIYDQSQFIDDEPYREKIEMGNPMMTKIIWDDYDRMYRMWGVVELSKYLIVLNSNNCITNDIQDIINYALESDVTVLYLTPLILKNENFTNKLAITGETKDQYLVQTNDNKMINLYCKKSDLSQYSLKYHLFKSFDCIVSSDSLYELIDIFILNIVKIIIELEKNEKEGNDKDMININMETRKENMTWDEAFKDMQEKKAQAKLPSWGGYWSWEPESDKEDAKMTIMMHLKEGGVEDIRETDRAEYTFEHMGRKDWICVYPGDKDYDKIIVPEFNHEVATNYLDRGIKITRKSWNGKYFLYKTEGDNCEIMISVVGSTEEYNWSTARGKLDEIATDYTFYNESDYINKSLTEVKPCQLNTILTFITTKKPNAVLLRYKDNNSLYIHDKCIFESDGTLVGSTLDEKVEDYINALNRSSRKQVQIVNKLYLTVE